MPAASRVQGRTDLVVLCGLLLFELLQAWIIANFSGTYDAGDSVMHFLFAQHVPAHPENLLDHWAKPFFTLLATPFAQFGFPGMKAMQCLLALATAWMAYRYAALSAWRMPWLAPLFVLASPAYFLAQFSGLTEPLFACMLIAGALLMLLRRYWAAALLLSLLPFVRTEGFLIIGVYALGFAWQRAWWPALGLGAGLVLYSVAGAFCYDGDFLWIFTQNPYQSKLDNYGAGNWGHYFQQYLYVVGVPLYGLTILGVLAQAVRLPGLLRWRGKFPAVHPTWPLTVMLPFAVYFLMHVYFWATGTGHSLGMVRVMIAIVPLGALVALYGLHALVGLIPATTWKLGLDRLVMALVALYVALFPFIPNPASLQLPKDLNLSADQALLQAGCIWMQGAGLQAAPTRPIYGSHPSLALFMDVDPFDSTAYRKLYTLTRPVPSKSIMIWDSWFSEIEDGVAPGYWDGQAEAYTLLWRRDTVVQGARSEIRIYEHR
jgi:hypothetical protein